MLNFLFGKESPVSRRAFLFMISLSILLFSVVIALFKDSINSFSVTFLNRGIGLFGTKIGISSSSSILSNSYFFFSSFPKRISSMLFMYLFNRISDLILKRSEAAKRTLLEIKKSASSIFSIFSRYLSVKTIIFTSQGFNCSVLIKS